MAAIGVGRCRSVGNLVAGVAPDLVRVDAEGVGQWWSDRVTNTALNYLPVRRVFPFIPLAKTTTERFANLWFTIFQGLKGKEYWGWETVRVGIVSAAGGFGGVRQPLHQAKLNRL